MLFQHKEILSDEALLRLIRLGDDDGLSILHSRFDELVFRVASAIVGDHRRAKTIRQKVFSLVRRQASDYSLIQGSAKAWILRETYSASFDCLLRINIRNAARHSKQGRGTGLLPARTRILRDSGATREKRKKRPADRSRGAEKRTKAR